MSLRSSDMAVSHDPGGSGGLEASDRAVIEGQKRALELAVTGRPLREILDAIVRTVEAQSTRDVLGSILLVEGEERLIHGAAPSLPPAYCAAVDGIPIAIGIGSCGTAAASRSTVVVEDVATDPLWKDFRALAIEHGLRACWSTPIWSTTGEVLGTFALYHRRPALPSARDVEIVELLGRTATIVIERARHAERQAAAEAALRHARDAESARIRAIFERAPAAIALVRGEEHVVEVANGEAVALFGGRASTEIVGRTLREVAPDLRDRVERVRRSGKAAVGHAERLAGTDAHYDSVCQPLPEADGRNDAVLVMAFDVTELVVAKQRAESDQRAARALAEEIALQSRQTQDLLVEMRRAKEQAERRLAELSTSRALS